MAPALHSAAGMFLTFLAFLLACAPTPVDAWTPTRAACGLAPGSYASLRDTWPDETARHQLPITEDCARALFADVNADPEALLTEDGYAGTLAEHLDDGAALETASDAVHGLEQGLYWLLAGSTTEVPADAWVSTSWSDVMEGGALDGETAAQARYNLVVSRIAGITVERDGYTAMATDGTVSIADYLARGAPPVAAAMLVHESRHRDGVLQNHVPCPGSEDPLPGCDTDDEGAVGWGVTSLTLDLHADPAWDNACGDADESTEHARDHLLAWRDLWTDRLILDDAPPADRDRCA